MIHRISKKKTNQISLPKSDIAILGILHESIRDYDRPLTGKEINDVISLANYKYWVDIEYSTVYNCLKRLEKQDLVKGNYSKKNKRRVKLYYLTQKGKDQLAKEIEESIRFPVRTKNPIDLGIKNLFVLPKSFTIKCLQEYIRKLEKMVKYYEKIVSGLKMGKPGDKIDHIPITEANLHKIPIVLALFERPYLELVARQKWLKEFVNKLISKDIDW